MHFFETFQHFRKTITFPKQSRDPFLPVTLRYGVPFLPPRGRLWGSSPCQMGDTRARDLARGPSGTPVPTKSYCCRTVRRGRRPLPTEGLLCPYQSQKCNLCRRRVRNLRRSRCAMTRGTVPQYHVLRTRHRETVPGIMACGFAPLLSACGHSAPQNFDSVAAQPSLRMTRRMTRRMIQPKNSSLLLARRRFSYAIFIPFILRQPRRPL